MMRKKWVAGNWKMNGRLDSITHLVNELKKRLTSMEQSSCLVFPPSIYIPLTETLLKGSSMGLGAQNAYYQDSGAYTGEVAIPMLMDFSCHYLLVGHSERRYIFNENEKIIRDKFHHAKLHGMIPVLCVGETLEQRENGLTEQVLAAQISAIAENNARSFEKAVIAYEPVWAIGSGKTATPEMAEAAHQYIREVVAAYNEQDAAMLTLLYGGSVNAANAKALFAMPNIDGGLVGGASLEATQFVEIVKCIN